MNLLFLHNGILLFTSGGSSIKRIKRRGAQPVFRGGKVVSIVTGGVGLCLLLRKLANQSDNKILRRTSRQKTHGYSSMRKCDRWLWTTNRSQTTNEPKYRSIRIGLTEGFQQTANQLFPSWLARQKPVYLWVWLSNQDSTAFKCNVTLENWQLASPPIGGKFKL